MNNRFLGILLALTMALALLPGTALAAEPGERGAFSDTGGHWAEEAINEWAGYDVLRGANGQFRPNDPITRAELATVLDRVIGYLQGQGFSFGDAPSAAWYYDALDRLYAAGVMVGDGSGNIRPLGLTTREEAAVLFSRVFALETGATAEDYVDQADISGWAAPYVAAMRAGGYMIGDDHGRFRPQSSLTRAEAVTILANIIDAFFKEAGVYDGKGAAVSANALVCTGGVTLQGYAIARNLYLTEGVGDGETALDNVTVAGTIFLRGGSRLTLQNSSAARLLVSRETALDLDAGSRIDLLETDAPTQVTGSGKIGKAIVNKEASGSSFQYWPQTIELAPGATVTVAGRTYTNNGDQVRILTWATDGYTPPPPPPPELTATTGQTVYESGLPNGTEATTDKETTSGEITLELHGAAGTVTIGGTAFAVNGSGNATNLTNANRSVNTDKGTLAISAITGGTVTYTYTLTAAQTHPTAGTDTQPSDEIAVRVTTAGGTADDRITVAIIDDAPQLTVPGKHEEHATEVANGSMTDTFTAHFGADGAGGDPAFTFDGHTLLETSGESWLYVDAEGLYTVTVIRIESSGNRSRYAYALEYKSSKVKEGFGGDLKLMATDGDQDSTIGTIPLAVTNTAPEATGEAYTIRKELGYATRSGAVRATLGESLITVGGSVDNTITAGWMTGKQNDNFTVLQSDVEGDLFGEFFSAPGIVQLDLATLKDAPHIFTLRMSSGTTAEEIQAAVRYASEHNLLLYIEGKLYSASLGSTPVNCITIVDGNFTVNSAGFGANSFLYVTRDVQAGTGFTVSGGLAIGGDLTGSASIEVEHTLNVFTPEDVVIRRPVAEGAPSSVSAAFSFAELLRNDTDGNDAAASKDGLHVTEITIKDKTYNAATPSADIVYDDATKISIDWTKGIITVVNTGESSASIQFGYTAADRHGATDSADITVNVTATTATGN